MKRYLTGWLVLAAAIAAVQGPAVRHGLVLDDYNHRAELRDGNWSLESLVAASHLGGEDRRVAMWWQDEADQYFFRPVAFLCLRAAYVLGDWQPWSAHLASLLWTLVGGMLVVVLADRLTGHLGWATLAGVLFVLHPNNAMTVRWVACQNQLMATAFLLAGVLLFARSARWTWRCGEEAGRSGRRGLTLLGALACFVLALGCRENAVAFVPIVVAGDWLLRPGRLRGRWPIYGALMAVVLAYLILRTAMLPDWRMPGRPYAYPLGHPGFARFVIDKFVYYVLGVCAYVPIVGFSGLQTMRANPAAFYGVFAVIAGLCLVAVRWLAVRPAFVFALCIIVFPLLPVLPVFASSHHLYLASVGSTLAVVMVLAGLSKSVGRWAAPRRRRAARGAIGILAGLNVLVCVAGNVIHDTAMAGFVAAGLLPVREIELLGRPLKPDDRLFFINLPMLAFNCMPAIEERAGVEPLHGVALTFAPGLMRMKRAGRIDRVDERTLRVRLEEPGYFSGLAGASMLEAIGRAGPFAVGETFTAEDFTVTIVEADEEGIYAMDFAFEYPLWDTRYHFLLGSPVFSAYPLRFQPNSQ